MSIAQMHQALLRQPYGPSWVRKVENMPDYQVAAVYNRMLNANKLQ